MQDTWSVGTVRSLTRVTVLALPWLPERIPRHELPTRSPKKYVTRHSLVLHLLPNY